MIKNYFKTAWRNLVKNKLFSGINIVGLAIGLASFLLIALYVLDELSYDKSYPNADRIYRINTDIKFGGNESHFPVSSDPMGPTLKKDYPQVEEYTRLYKNGNKQIKKGTEYINEYSVIHADSTFFNVFELPVIAGNTRTALNEPNTVVITESTAKKYFGTTDVVGKTLETTDHQNTVYKIMAVVKDFPHNSHFGFDFIFSMKNVRYQWGNFLSNNFYTYIKLKKGTDYKAFEKNFDQVLENYAIPQARQFMNINSMDEFKKAGNFLVYTLMPITKIHLYSDRSFELTPSGSIEIVYVFSAVALFILLIACINFMNLTTARSANRAREVGIRKVLGTQRKTLVAQFLSESTLTAIIGLLLAFGITILILPLFNAIANKSMKIQDLFTSSLLPLLIALPIVVGLIAGSYPALYLSKFKPVNVLKGNLFLSGKSGRLRNALVIFQFAISTIIITGTIIIYRQLNYIQTKNLGFNKDQILVINDSYELGTNAISFKNEMLQEKGVISGTLSGYLPVSNSARNDNTLSKDPVLDAKNGIDMQIWQIDCDYMKTMGMEMKAGRNFSPDFPTDSSAVIINETTQKLLGYDNAVGQKLYQRGSKPTDPITSMNIIGVVKDFHFESLRKNIGPLCFVLDKNNWLASFKVNAADVPNILKSAEAKWKTMAGGMPFTYEFMDESFNQMYRSEQKVGKLALIFAVLAIVIACLGLFGLATFIAEQKTKEIGIRKVLGANVTGIIKLLSGNFLKLVLIAFIISMPVSWWIMNKWLQDFAYRTNIGWWMFAIAGFIALVIALLTISIQSIKAAIANPVKSLRTE